VDDVLQTKIAEQKEYAMGEHELTSQFSPQPQRPPTKERDEWCKYWQAQGQAWRTEPEIDKERQEYLARRLIIMPVVEGGVYPFKDVKLNRADVEWLLAAWENGRGPVDGNDEQQRERKGLDMRGAILPQVDLSNLPLAHLRCGLSTEERSRATEEHYELAAAQMAGAKLSEAHLEGAALSGVHLEDADLSDAHLEDADLSDAHLEGATLRRVHAKRAKFIKAHSEDADLHEARLEDADLREAHLEDAYLSLASLEGADLGGAHLEDASLIEVNLENANLSWSFLTGVKLIGARLKKAKFMASHLEAADLTGANLESAILSGAHLEKAHLSSAHLENVFLNLAHLEKANLGGAHLEGATLYRVFLKGANLTAVDLEGANLYGAHLENADLSGASLKGSNLSAAYLEETILYKVSLINEKHVGPRLQDVRWANVNLAIVNWSQVGRLGDEHIACQKKHDGKVKDKTTRLAEYEAAVRANRQLSAVLQAQELNEHAARFAYHAQVLQKSVPWFQMLQPGTTLRQKVQTLGAWFFSWFLFLLAGYGYKPGRCFITYLLVITGFATTYYLLGRTVGPSLSPLGAFVFSMTSFHGRGFFPGGIQLDDPLTVLAALEAFVGLLIEVTFIATLTQRLFSK